MEKKVNKRLIFSESPVTATDEFTDEDYDPKRKKDKKNSDIITTYNLKSQMEDQRARDQSQIEDQRARDQYKHTNKISMINTLLSQGKTPQEIKTIITELWEDNDLGLN
jgi:hypothetical protein